MLSGLLPTLIFGVAMGNVIEGVPFHFDDMLRFFYTGTFWALLNPFALLCGLLSIAMLSMHGAVYLCTKTLTHVQIRARKAGLITASVVIVLFFIGGIWVQQLAHYAFVHPVLTDAPSNPLHKLMRIESHHAFANYVSYPLFILAPLCGFTGALLTILLLSFKQYRSAFLSSALCIFGIIATVGVSLFPVLLPSSSDPSQSLLIWDASSSKSTLLLMLGVGIVFLPIIIAYTTWVYRVMRGPVNQAWLADNDKVSY